MLSFAATAALSGLVCRKMYKYDVGRMDKYVCSVSLLRHGAFWNGGNLYNVGGNITSKYNGRIGSRLTVYNIDDEYSESEKELKFRIGVFYTHAVIFGMLPALFVVKMLFNEIGID